MALARGSVCGCDQKAKRATNDGQAPGFGTRVPLASVPSLLEKSASFVKVLAKYCHIVLPVSAWCVFRVACLCMCICSCGFVFMQLYLRICTGVFLDL